MGVVVARLGVLMFVLVALAGCGQSPRSNEASATVAPSQPTEPAATARAVQITPVSNRDAFWRQLTERLDRPPFALEYLHRGRGQIVATYDGDLGTYVACGGSIGVAQPAGAGTEHLQSRVLIYVVEGSDGSANVSTNVIHVVSLRQSASRAADFIAVRADAPARTGDGRYCWSTGAMERLALAP